MIRHCSLYIWLLILLIFSSFVIGCSNRDEQPFQGYIEGDFTYIASQVGGKLLHKYVKRGQWVKENKTLFQLEKAPEKQDYERAKHKYQEARAKLADFKKGSRATIIRAKKSELKQVKAQLNYAKKTLKRRQNLYNQQAIDTDALDRAKRNYHNILQQLRQVKAELAEARLGRRQDIIRSQKAAVQAAKANKRAALWRLQEKTIEAPTDALVYDTFYEQGEVVEAGKPVLALLAPANEKLVFYVPEAVRSRLQKGQKVRIQCDGCDKTYTAHIDYIANKAEFTPPVIFSRQRRNKLVYRVEGQLSRSTAKKLNVGQPVDVYPWKQ